MVTAKIKLSKIEDIYEFLDCVNELSYDVDLQRDRYVVDARSTMGIFTLNLSEPVDLVIHSDDNKLLESFSKWFVKVGDNN